MIDAGNLTVVSEELDYIQKFMEIERLRFGDEIICHYQIDPTVLSWKMVRLSLQPLVENAISHGIRPHNCKGNIYIKINRLYEGMLYVSVEDDGVGMSREEINIFNSRSSQEYVYASQHVGLVNLAQRIMLVYGEDCTLMLDQSAYGGLRVEMTLPQT